MVTMVGVPIAIAVSRWSDTPEMERSDADAGERVVETRFSAAASRRLVIGYPTSCNRLGDPLRELHYPLSRSTG